MNEPEYWHVIPNNDLMKHDTESQENCWCNPKIEEQDNGNWVIVHNSLDGREYKEKDNDKYGKIN